MLDGTFEWMLDGTSDRRLGKIREEIALNVYTLAILCAVVCILERLDPLVVLVLDGLYPIGIIGGIERTAVTGR